MIFRQEEVWVPNTSCWSSEIKYRRACPSVCEETRDPKDFSRSSSRKFPQPPSMTSFHPSIPPPFFFLTQISHSMPCTCFSVIWTLAENFKQLSKWTEFFPLLLYVSFSFLKEHSRASKYTWSEGREMGIMICKWGFVISVDIRYKAEQRRGNMKRWQLNPPPPPSTLFSITSPLKHIGLPKPWFFFFI